MFNHLYMNKLLFLFFLSITFLKCDGRDRKHKTNEEVLKQNNLLDSFSEDIIYHPENYEEHISDTVFSNGFHVKISNYTDMNNSIASFKIRNEKSNNHYFRKLISNVIITKDSKEIFNENLDGTFFKKVSKVINIDLDSCLISTISVEADLTKKNYVKLNCMFYEPKKNKASTYSMIVNEIGNYRVKKEEDSLSYSK